MTAFGPLFVPEELLDAVSDRAWLEAMLEVESALARAEAAAGAWSVAGCSGRKVDGSAQGLWLSQVDAWDWNVIDLRPAFVEASGGFAHGYADADLNRASPGRVRPYFLLESLKNNAFSFLAGWYDLRGGNTSTSGFGASSTENSGTMRTKRWLRIGSFLGATV